MRSYFHGAEAGSHEVGYLRQRDPPEPVERDDFALVLGELSEREHHRLLGVHALLSAWRNGRFGCVGPERCFGFPTRTAEILSLQIHGDREQPRLQERSLTKILAAPVELQKSLLHEIAGVLGLPHLVSQDARQDRGMAIEQLAEGVCVALDVGGHEIFVGPHADAVVGARSGVRLRRIWHMAHSAHPIFGVFGPWPLGILCALVCGMESQWKSLARPALVGFVVGLLVMTGLSYVAPQARMGPRPALPVR